MLFGLVSFFCFPDPNPVHHESNSLTRGPLPGEPNENFEPPNYWVSIDRPLNSTLGIVEMTAANCMNAI